MRNSDERITKMLAYSAVEFKKKPTSPATAFSQFLGICRSCNDSELKGL